MFRGAIAIVLLVALASVAEADGNASLAQARRDVDASDYPAARTALVAALGAGGASPDELAEIYKLTGIVESALADTTAAEKAFARWLALDPKAELPAGTSPKIMRPFDAAKAKRLPALKIKTETSADPPKIVIVVGADPLALIARARVYVKVDGAPEKKLDATGKDKFAVTLPRGKRLDLRVQALDAHGNAVAELGSPDLPLVITSDGKRAEPVAAVPPPTTAPSRDETPAPSRPLYLQWYAWGGAAVVFGAASAYFGLAARSAKNDLEQLNANSSAHDFSEAQAVESRARRDLVLFDVGLGVTGAFAIGAAVLYLTEPHVRAETRVGAVPLAGGGALVVGGRF